MGLEGYLVGCRWGFFGSGGSGFGGMVREVFRADVS